MSKKLEKRLSYLKERYENGILDEETYQDAVVGAKAKYQAETESGAVAQGEGAIALASKAVNVGGNVGGNIITGNIYYGESTDDPEEALRIYRTVLVNSNSTLPMQGIDKSVSDPTTGKSPLGLTHVYIDLDTTTQIDVSEKESEKSRASLRSSEIETKPLPALQAVIQNRQLVLLGDPGGGKTTFIRHLAHALAAHALKPSAGLLNGMPNWAQAEANILPIVVILRDFARSLPHPLPAKATPNDLWAFIQTTLTAQNLDFAADTIRHTLEAGQAIILLDGLDEVPTQAQRIFVRDAVSAFVRRYHVSNRVIVTCRILSYQPPVEKDAPDLRLPSNLFPAFELAPFDEEKIDGFIDHWYRELARLMVVPSQDVTVLTGKLKTAVRRKDLWRLASNPLLLTVMALVHAHSGRLPDARALLYEETIDILLLRWEQKKVSGQAETVQLRQLIQQAERSDMDLKKVLWKLAYEAHRQVAGDEGGEKLADIGELTLIKALAGLKKVDGKPDLTWASRVVEVMKLRAGLLLEREPGLFTFPHRTFQEYMAGAYLSLQPKFAKLGCDLATEGVLWREVILLAVGRFVYINGDESRPLLLVSELCPLNTTDDAVGWYKVWLAGDVLSTSG